MAKRLFQVLDEMNVHDTEQGTQWITLHPDVMNAQLVQKGKGCKVTVGVPVERFSPNDLYDISNGVGTKRVVLMIVDGKEFDKRIKQ